MAEHVLPQPIAEDLAWRVTMEALAERGCESEDQLPGCFPFYAACPVCRGERALRCDVEPDGRLVLRCEHCPEERAWDALDLRKRVSEAFRARAEEWERQPKVSPTADGAPIRFLKPAELRAQTPARPPWVIDGYVARGALTIGGGSPKVGKTTTFFALAVAVAARAPSFLGRAVTGGPVVVVTEEGAQTALDKLPDHDDIRILTREGAWPKPSWPELIAAAVAEARRIGAVMLLIDSFAFWASLPPDAENDAGAAQAALAPLLEAASAQIGVLLVHHARKSGGAGGLAFRGSTAITGAADALLEIERLEGEETPPRFRRLVAVSRWPDTPGVLVFDYNPAERSWRVVGHGEGREDSAVIAWRERILNALPNTEPGATYDDLGTVLPGGKKDWLSALNGLTDDGRVTATGRGVKGDPKRYRRTPQNSIPGFHSSAGTETAPAPPMKDSVFRSTPVGGTESESSSNGKSFDSVQERNGNDIEFNADTELARVRAKFGETG